MIPARLGSQRLRKKNLAEIDGIPLVAHAVRKCVQSGCFDSVWLNSESEVFEAIALREGGRFHQRPSHLGGNDATSEDFVAEFLQTHECDFVVQVHSIAPLLTITDITNFVKFMQDQDFETVLSVVEENLECVYEGRPINFDFSKKTNSQELRPVQRIVWSISAWKREVYLEATREGQCATYSGNIGFFPINRIAGHVIKVQDDLDIATVLYPLTSQSR